jgi:hypothetical protein
LTLLDVHELRNQIVKRADKVFVNGFALRPGLSVRRWLRISRRSGRRCSVTTRVGRSLTTSRRQILSCLRNSFRSC